MGEQSNLTEDNVEELTKQLKKMQEDNPELEYQFFQQAEEVPDENEPRKELLTLVDVYDKLLDLERKLDRIFGESVLIDGQFKDITLKDSKQR